MEHIPFISVIMPVYNVEHHLPKAIDSVLSQTFSDFELILVDDCSNDNSGKICDYYTARDSRIKVMHLEENQGAGYARNHGIVSAKGRYIHFMDSDDTMDSNTYERAVKSIGENPAKVIVFGAVEEYYNARGQLSFTKKIFAQERYYRDTQDLRKEIIYLESITLYGYLWNKLYDLNYIHELNITFSNMRLNEDIIFNIDYFMHIDSMNVIGIAPYHYAKRFNNSLTGRYVPEYFTWHRLRVEKLFKQLQYWSLCTEEVKNTLANIYVRYILSAIERSFDNRSSMKYDDRKNWIHNLYSDNLFMELMPFAGSNNRIVNTLCVCLAGKKTHLCLLYGWVIHIVKGKLPMLFSKLKQNK